MDLCERNRILETREVSNIISDTKSFLEFGINTYKHQVIILKVFAFCKETFDSIWAEACDDALLRDNEAARSLTSKILSFFHWIIVQDKDFGWFKDYDPLIPWLCQLMNDTNRLPELLMTHNIKLLQIIYILFKTKIPESGIGWKRMSKDKPQGWEKVSLNPQHKKKGSQGMYDEKFTKAEMGKSLAEWALDQVEYLKTVLVKIPSVQIFAVQCDLRLSLFELFVSKKNNIELKTQFQFTNFLDKVTGEYLCDYRNMIHEGYWLSSECIPIRGEAINYIQTLVDHKIKSPQLFDDLAIYLKRNLVVQSELQNLKIPDLQLSAIELLNILVSADDPRIDAVLLQERAYNYIGEVVREKPLLKLKFPKIGTYVEKYI